MAWWKTSTYSTQIFKNVRSKVDDFFDEDQITTNKSGDIIVTADCHEDEWVYSTILSFGSEVEVLEPKHIRKIIKERAQKILNTYNSALWKIAN